MADPTENVLVLGATGNTGGAFVQEALAASPTTRLTLLVRSPSKLSEDHTSNPRINIVKGQLDDATALAKAMKGATSVVSFLGSSITLSGFISRSVATPIADTFPAVFAAMRDAGVKRIMALSTVGGYRLPEDHADWRWRFMSYVLPVVVVPSGDAEMAKMGNLVSEQDDFDWTVFRMAHFNDGSPDLKVEAGYLGPEFKGSMELSRRSLGRWVFKELQEGKWIGKAPAVGNP